MYLNVLPSSIRGKYFTNQEEGDRHCIIKMETEGFKFLQCRDTGLSIFDTDLSA